MLHSPAIVERDKRAAEVVLKVMDRRAKLLGLEAPTKVQAEVVNYDGNYDYNEDIERIIGLLGSVDPGKPLSLESGASS